MKFTDVKIGSPCTEKLEKRGGDCSEYACASCAQTVHDFRNVTEYEFNKRLENIDSDRCGIFYMDQIDTEVYRNSATPKLLGFALSLLTLIGMSGSAVKAQTEHKSETENIVRDRASHGLIPRYGLAIEPAEPLKKEGTITACQKKQQKKKEYDRNVASKRRKFLGIFPRRHRVIRGKF